jgi:Cys-Gly metallodipeptidase DUG1
MIRQMPSSNVSQRLLLYPGNHDSHICNATLTSSPSSVSGDASRRQDVIKMANWLNDQLRAVGVTTQLTDLGKQHLEGQELPLPPAILGKLGDDNDKKTILVYGHFDVQPVSMIGLSSLSIR